MKGHPFTKYHGHPSIYKYMLYTFVTYYDFQGIAIEVISPHLPLIFGAPNLVMTRKMS